MSALDDLARDAARRGRPARRRGRRPGDGAPAPHGDAAGRRTRCSSRRSARATCSTTARGACCAPTTADLALLAGDRLYALGLARLADRGDLRGRRRARRPHLAVCAVPTPRTPTAPRAGTGAARSAGHAIATPRWRGAAPVGCPAAAGRYCSPSLPDRNARSCLTPARRPSPSTPPTAQIAGRLRGRDGHAPAVHDADRARRRRRRRVGVRCSPRSASRRARRSSSGPRCSGSRSARPRTSRTTPTSRRSSPRCPGVGEIGKTTVYMRARNDRRSTGRRTRSRCTRAPRTTFIAISTRCMHLGCPVRYVEASAALHLPVPRRRLRLRRRRLRRPAGAPARPLLRARARRPGRRSARATRSTPSSAASRATAIPGRTLDGIGQYMYPGRFSTPKLD